MKHEGPPVVEYQRALPAEPPAPDYFDYHPEYPAVAFGVVQVAAFFAVHLLQPQHQPHDVAMSVLFSGLIWGPWGTIRSIVRLATPLTESNLGAATALTCYVAGTLGTIFLMFNHDWLGPMNYAPT